MDTIRNAKPSSSSKGVYRDLIRRTFLSTWKYITAIVIKVERTIIINVATTSLLSYVLVFEISRNSPYLW